MFFARNTSFSAAVHVGGALIFAGNLCRNGERERQLHIPPSSNLPLDLIKSLTRQKIRWKKGRRGRGEKKAEVLDQPSHRYDYQEEDHIEM